MINSNETKNKEKETVNLNESPNKENNNNNNDSDDESVEEIEIEIRKSSKNNNDKIINNSSKKESKEKNRHKIVKEDINILNEEKVINLKNSDLQTKNEEIYMSSLSENQSKKRISRPQRNSPKNKKNMEKLIKKNKNSNKKEEKNIFNIDKNDSIDGAEILTESEVKTFNLNQVTLRFIDILYKNDFKLKLKEDNIINDDEILKIANLIIYMNKANQIKILECMKKAANNYIKIKIFEKLVKYVDEINKIKKFGIHD